MQVHRLSFAAIGPFADEHVIDFDGLGGSALFLIDGPTGAGKSTIIDALVFALFGEVAGSGSDKQRLRSGFAADGQESFAEVEFSTSFGRYRVRRTPEYPRTKKRGTGVTMEPSSVHLERATGEHGWESVSHNKGDADAQISRVLGLSRAQFLQTVVLPQGEFATFLKAESKDRQAVLQRIFATDLYARIEVTLDELRKQAETQRQAADLALGKAVTSVTDRLPNDEREALSESLVDVTDSESVLGAVAAILDAVGERLAQAEREIVEAEGAQRAVRAQLVELEKLGQVIAEAEKAAAVVASAQQRLSAANQALSARPELVATGESDLLASLDQLIGSLDHVVAKERELPAAERALAMCVTDVEKVRAGIAALERERSHELPARLHALSVALADAARVAREESSRCQRDEAELVEARVAGMAGELAADLRDGEPCPVCGSTDHPRPRAPEDRQVSADDVARAAKERSDADQAVQEWAVRTERLAVAAGGIEPVAEAAEAAPADIVAAIEKFQERVREVDSQLGSRRGDLVAAELASVQARGRLEEVQALVGASKAGFSSVSARREDLLLARAAVVEQQEAQGELTQAQVFAEEAGRAVAALDGEFDPALAAELTVQVASADASVRRAISRRDQVQSLLADLQQRALGVEERLAERNEVWARTVDVMSLANLVKGGDGNLLKQPLSAFVVQSMFDEILEAANRRLQVMLDGRFSLKATEERTGRALMGQGLGLEVVDQRTDSVRKTATLSGGESFCASLALALGLADTVRANAGGVELGMLFIDEGFGSLDGDRLDDVMAELLRLRADGRTVGVISHVSEMKKSINERIDVTPVDPRGGSVLSVSWAQ